SARLCKPTAFPLTEYAELLPHLPRRDPTAHSGSSSRAVVAVHDCDPSQLLSVCNACCSLSPNRVLEAGAGFGLVTAARGGGPFSAHSSLTVAGAGGSAIEGASDGSGGPGGFR